MRYRRRKQTFWDSMGCCGLGHEPGSGEVLPPGMELEREYQGYRYRAVDAAGREELVHAYEHIDEWRLPDGSRAYRQRYVCSAPQMILTAYSEDPSGGASQQVGSQLLPADALMITPAPPAGCTELLLPWIRSLMDVGVPGGKALVGVPVKGRQYKEPYCEDGDGNRSAPVDGVCAPEQGRIIHQYEEISLVRPTPEEIEWIFLLTQDIALVSRLSEMHSEAGVFLEPTAGWLLPAELPDGTLAGKEGGVEGSPMIYLGIGLAAAVAGYLIIRRMG